MFISNNFYGKTIQIRTVLLKELIQYNYTTISECRKVAYFLEMVQKGTYINVKLLIIFVMRLKKITSLQYKNIVIFKTN